MHLFQYGKLTPLEQVLWQKSFLKITTMKNDWQYGAAQKKEPH